MFQLKTCALLKPVPFTPRPAEDPLKPVDIRFTLSYLAGKKRGSVPPRVIPAILQVIGGDYEGIRALVALGDYGRAATALGTQAGLKGTPAQRKAWRLLAEHLSALAEPAAALAEE